MRTNLIVSFLCFVAMIAATACAPLSRRSIPDVRGTIRVAESLSDRVRVTRDDEGVVYIDAATREDAWFAQGFVHAQDRFFQMEFWRRIGQGRLSELFGESTLNSDLYLRTVDFHSVAEREFERAPDWLKRGLEAYAAGVNAYIAEEKPVRLSYEFTLLGLQGVRPEIEPWQPADSLAWVKVMSQDLGGDFDTELLRLNVIHAVGTEMAADVFRPYRYDEMPTVLLESELPVRRPAEGEQTGEALPTPELAELAVASEIEAVSDAGTIGELAAAFLAGSDAAAALGLGRGHGIGSNGWVVSGDHTESGMPLLANDPHLAIQIPSIFYQVHLSYTTPEGRDVRLFGYSFPGVPGVVIGHNQDIAWGLTNGFVDEQDLYLEQINPENPDEYLVEGEWVPVESRIESIEVSGREEPVIIRIRSTRNGPIISDNGGYRSYTGFGGEPASVFSTELKLHEISLRWNALDPGRSLESLIQINESTDFEEFRDALRIWSGPSQNFLYADRQGNIGYQLPGPVPTRRAGSGALPAPGWLNEYQWAAPISFDELPMVYNPDRGFIVTANNNWVGPEYPHFLGRHYVPGYRARRITSLLEAAIEAGPVTASTMKSIQLDTYDESSKRIIALLGESNVRANPVATAALNMLEVWDGEMIPDSSGAALFAAVIVEAADEIYSDEFEPAFWEDGVFTRSTPRILSSLELLLGEPANGWWDDRHTLGTKEERDAVVAQILEEAYTRLAEELSEDPSRWRLGDLTSLTLTHQTMGSSGISIIERMFNRGPYETSGGTNVVNRHTFRLYDPDQIVFAGTVRMIADLSDWSKSEYATMSGQSGHIRSGNYDGEIRDWINGVYETKPWSAEEIEAIRGPRMVLEPPQ